MTVQFLTLYIDPKRHNAQCYNRTDRQTDRQTDGRTTLWCQQPIILRVVRSAKK